MIAFKAFTRAALLSSLLLFSLVAIADGLTPAQSAYLKFESRKAEDAFVRSVAQTAKARESYVASQLSADGGPVVAATDYMRNYAEQIRPYVPTRYSVLGTDGFGRSDMREKLREFFEVDRRYVAIAALKALADDGVLKPEQVSEAIAKYGIDPDKPNPVTV